MGKARFKHLILDFDGVIGSSASAVCKACEILIDGKKYNPENVKKWNFQDEIPEMSPSDIASLFDQNLFWECLEPVEGAKELIEAYREHIIICTCGSSRNIEQKLKYIRKNFGDVTVIPVVKKLTDSPKTIDKNMINMEGCIFVEDSQFGLLSTNASLNVLFNEYDAFDCEWNSRPEAGWILSGCLKGLKQHLDHNVEFGV